MNKKVVGIGLALAVVVAAVGIYFLLGVPPIDTRTKTMPGLVTVSKPGFWLLTFTNEVPIFVNESLWPTHADISLKVGDSAITPLNRLVSSPITGQFNFRLGSSEGDIIRWGAYIVLTDKYPSGTTWELLDSSTLVLLDSGTLEV